MFHLEPLIDHQLVQKTVRSVLHQDDAFSDLFAEQTTAGVCKVTTDAMHTMEVRSHQGVSLRRVNVLAQRLAHTPNISEAGVAMLAKALEHGTTVLQTTAVPSMNDWMPPMDEMVHIGRAVAAEVERQGNGKVQAQVVLRHVRQVFLVGRPDGRIVQNVRYYTKMSIDALIRQGRKIRRGNRQAGSAQPLDLAENDNHLRLAQQAAEAACRQLEAVPAPTGEMTVILGPGGPATLLHEACGHPLEADLAQHPMSAYHGRLGKRVSSPLVTIVDDPVAALGPVPIYHVDDEGEPAQPTILIDNGILRNYLYDRRTALIEGHTSNGHGRRLSYAYPPLPRMSATYLVPGEMPPEDIIKETKYGLFVRDIAGGKTDMGSGRFNLRVNECYLVEDGQITAPLRGAILSGYGPDVLCAIDQVGNDFEFLSLAYGCNKLDQFPMLVTVGQPTIRIQGLAVRGV